MPVCRLAMEEDRWFDEYRQADFARAGAIASETVELPEGPRTCVAGVGRRRRLTPSLAISFELPHAGPLMSHGEKVAHSLEPMFRKLGLPTILKNGQAEPPQWTTSSKTSES